VEQGRVRDQVHDGDPGLLELNWPFSIDMQAVRDVAVVVIYNIFFIANIILFVKWQDRKPKSEATEEKAVVVGRSRFGRPLKAKA